MEAVNQQSLPHGYVLQGEKNRYTIVRVLGQGSFGITYLAKFKSMVQGSMGAGVVQSLVAIKEFYMRDINTRNTSNGRLNDITADSLSGRYRRAFMREARNLSSITHPNIVNVFEVIEANNTVYIVMEYINGGSLDDYIERRGFLSEQESIIGIRKICSAVKCIHSNKILHLDIKPKNIMFDEDGGMFLIDFGLSKQYSDNGEPESSTSIGLGTPGYAPVEQAEHQDGDKQFRATLDIYALGATLFKMLTGNTPPKASQVSDSVIDGNNIISEQLKNAGISEGLVAVVVKAMWPSSRGRYQTVEDFDSALHNIILTNNQKIQDENVEDESTQIIIDQPTQVSTPASDEDGTVVITNTPIADSALNKELEKDKQGVIKPVTKPSFEITNEKKDKKSKTPMIFVIIGIIIFIIISIPKGNNGKLNNVPSKDNRIQTSTNNNRPTTPETTTTPSNSATLATTSNDNNYEFVDLGLSVKWATCNIGANKPEESGLYCGWGETNLKNNYTWDNYKFRYSGNTLDDVRFSKYNTMTSRGTVDNKTIIDPSDDIATKTWGNDWRIPTMMEFEELINNCAWTWTSINGINGYKITSEKMGYYGRSIFLPAAGICRGEYIYDKNSLGNYWASTLSSDSYYAYCLSISSNYHSTTKQGRYCGYTIRPVRK